MELQGQATMAGDVQQLLSELTAAVEIIMDPNIGQAERHNATQFCENCKETSPLCLECGLILTGQEYPPTLRHFGLQLIEHCIKFRWNNMSEAEKNALKMNALRLMSKGTRFLLEEETYVKDAVSRIAVELIKREWPQHWPSLLDDLHKISLEGPTQTELVMKVFLRLAEDVMEFFSLPTQRRREVCQALTAQMSNIFQFFLSIMQTHLQICQGKSQGEAGGPTLESRASCQVVRSVLETLCGYVGWVNMTHIAESNPCLLQHLCLLLRDSQLQLPAAECLLLIVSRKGKMEERKPLLVLFSEEAMSSILSAAVDAESSASQDEYFYLFLKRLCQVLTEIGKQLSFLWGLEGVGKPPNFCLYLKALLAFTGHPSQVLCNNVMSLWKELFSHEEISKDPDLLSFLPSIVQTTNRALLRYGFPSQSNSPGCHYSRLDFDSDEDFNMFFSKHRCAMVEVLRHATTLAPKMTFSIASEWLLTQLKKPLDTGEVVDKGVCSLNSPSYLEWEALPVCLESVMSRLLQSPNPKPEVAECVQLLEAVLNYQTEDPLILSCLLSCLSALYVFLPHTTQSLPIVLQKIFSAVKFNLPGQTKGTRSRAVRNVRQHACSGLVKLCKQCPQLVFPVFGDLKQHVREISEDPEQLSKMEKCILTEALLLISNEFNNFEKQSEFIREVLAPVKTLWGSAEFAEAFSSPDKFMAYIGLDRPAVEPSSADTCGINRSHITYCIQTMLAVMKRSQWPKDAELQEAGGFVVRLPDGTAVLRNPATSHLIDLMNNLMALISTLNALWTPEALARRHPDFTRAYDLMENEKLHILGRPMPCSDSDSTNCKQPLERMQNFLHLIHESSFHILGNAGQCLGYEFYTAPSLLTCLLHSVFQFLDNLPDYRLRPIIRVFMKPYIQRCPRECYASAVVPVLQLLCPYMHQRLSTKWLQINQRSLNSEENEEDWESQEVLEDQLTRQLTREYLEMLAIVFIQQPKQELEVADEAMDEDMEKPQQSSGQEKLNELGQLCIQERITSCVETVFACLHWHDTIACSKSIRLCLPILKQLLLEEMLTGEATGHLLTCVLQGLNLHGQHDNLQPVLLTLGMQMYEMLRPQFQQVVQVMLMVPNVTQEALQSFDEKVLQKQMNEKKKREAFKSLVSEIIGQNVGQQFKRDVQFKNLPPMLVPKRRKNRGLMEEESHEIGLNKLFAACEEGQT